MRIFRALPLLLSLLALSRPAVADLDVSEAWIKQLPPNVPVRAGYMTLHNSGERSIAVVGLRSPAFGSIEIHRTVERDGMMQMDPVPRLEIAAGASVILAPGGLHLMMMMPREATRPGMPVPVTLVFADGSEQDLVMTVRK